MQLCVAALRVARTCGQGHPQTTMVRAVARFPPKQDAKMRKLGATKTNWCDCAAHAARQPARATTYLPYQA